MRRFLLIVAAAALSAWGQTGLEAQKGGGTSSNQHTTVMVQGADGQWHQLQTPMTIGQLQGLVQGSGTVDLENMINSQSGCPVQIVDASFERPAQLLLTSHTPADTGPTLRLDYRNSSGKRIESVVFTGWIKVKDSPYQLDSVTHPFQLELSPNARRGKGGKAFRLVGNALGFDRIELSRVVFADGTTWTPQRQSCVYGNRGNAERAEAR